MSDSDFLNISQMKDGDLVKTRLVVRGKTPPRNYKHKPGRYFFLTVGDSSGQMQLKYWGGLLEEKTMKLFNELKVGNVLELEGEVAIDKFDNTLGLTLTEGTSLLKIMNKLEFNGNDFLPRTICDTKAMVDNLKDLLVDVENQYLRALLESFWMDIQFVEELQRSPASVMHHHNHMGGLLEHTLNVTRTCTNICRQYSDLDRDLLLTGAFVHDLGKMESYVADTTIDMNDQGRFLGHLTLGLRILEKHIQSVPDFPQVLTMKLSHLLMSHHAGRERNETSAPRGLKIPEASALFHANLMDANVAEYLGHVKDQAGLEDDWLYIREIGNEVYRK